MDGDSLKWLLCVAAAASALVTIAAHYLRPQRLWLIYVYKPLTTTLILLVALLPQPGSNRVYESAIALGLLFALGGDVWLMLPSDRFLYGLASFLVTHLCYSLAFIARASGHTFPWPIIVFLLASSLIVRHVWPALKSRLKGPVSLYAGVIAVMAGLAVTQALAHHALGSLSAAGGALLLLVSDALLAVDRFRGPIRGGRAVILGTYFAGQLMIALSVGLQAPGLV
jgi:uncharacterized membrane protein YhhN